MKATIQQIQFIQQKYLQKTDDQLSDALGISKRTVAKIRKEMNLKRSEWTETKLGIREGNEPEPVDEQTLEDIKALEGDQKTDGDGE
jgi:hypothetical protein